MSELGYSHALSCCLCRWLLVDDQVLPSWEQGEFVEYLSRVLEYHANPGQDIARERVQGTPGSP